MSALGFVAAKGAVEAGRSAFFGSASFDLPPNRSSDVAANDWIPQFGFTGKRFESTRILLLGINPGNGSGQVASASDQAMLPHLRTFAESPSADNFLRAQAAYFEACESWSIWDRHCTDILTTANLTSESIAYSNCLPWRTGSEAAFDTSVARRTATLYAGPLVGELEPRVIIAVGKKAMAILELSKVKLPDVIVWNRARAPTASVIRDREVARERLRSMPVGP
jgi:hypothetical protein